MKVSNKILKNVSLIYILLPIICFFIGYLRIYISCFLILISFLIWRLYTKSNAKESIAKDEFFISKKVFITIILFSLLFIFISGICNITYQPNFFPDYLIRNNIFRDLIFETWPVQYSSHTYLCYYISQWLVPAFFGKGLSIIISDANLVLLISNIILYIWYVLGMILVFLWIVRIFRKCKTKYIILILISFLLFSGLDIIGDFVLDGKLTQSNLLNGFEWWARMDWQYSSFESFIFWASNQAIVPLLIILMTYQIKDYNNYIMLFVLGLFYGPFQILGLGLYILTSNIIECIKNKSLKLFKKYFSLQNILAVIFILPVVSLYYLSHYSIVNHVQGFKLKFDMSMYILFVFLEFLIYVILIFKRRDESMIPLIIITIYLLIMPTFGDVNVMLKIPIPFLVILWIYMMKFLLCDNSKYKVRKIIVIILLAVAALNPISEIKGRCKNIVKYHYFMVDNQKIDMLNLPKYYKAQYLTVDKETFFFKYLARNDSIKKS